MGILHLLGLLQPRTETLNSNYICEQNQDGTDSEETFYGRGGINIVKAEAHVEAGASLPAAHYIADASDYTLAHPNYEGNGKFRNADGIFSTWRPADWMVGNAMLKDTFSLSKKGIVTVKVGGIYYLYAQIHYLDRHDINGYYMQVNTDHFLQCTVMAETKNGDHKTNTCFTGGVTLLKPGDRVWITDIEKNRFSILKPEKSFFGLIQLSRLPLETQDNE